MPLIVFFDGHCGLCNKAVDFILLHDKKNIFKFSPLQGEYIKSLNTKAVGFTHPVLPTAIDPNKLDTIYVYDGTNIYSKTEAIRLIGKNLSGIWKFLSLFTYLLPLPVSDKIYDFISRNRYKVFGRSDTCRLPTPSEAPKFLP